jgi:hypothetical protein
MYQYVIVLRACGEHQLAWAFDGLIKGVLSSRGLKAAQRASLLGQIEVLARECVRPRRSRHLPAFAAAIVSVSAATADNVSLSALWAPLRWRVKRLAS